MQDSWLRKKGWWNPVLCRQKGHENVLWCTQDCIWSPGSGTTPLLSADGISLLTDKEAILKRWAEHFDGVLNRSSSINDEAINRLPQVECNPLLDELPTISETVKAAVIWQGSWIRCNTCRDLQSRRSSSCRELFHIMWRKEAIPQEFKDATIIHLFKRKGNPQVCDNHRGISLLSIAGRILARVLLNRLNEHLERSGLLTESQCGFRKNRRTIDMIFTARQLHEKCQEQNVDLYMTFLDLTKAFDIVIVSREGLWKIMAKLGCPAKFIAMVRHACKGPKWCRVFWSIPCDKWSSAWCFLPCLQMLSRMVTMIYLLGIALIGNFST